MTTLGQTTTQRSDINRYVVTKTDYELLKDVSDKKLKEDIVFQKVDGTIKIDSVDRIYDLKIKNVVESLSHQKLSSSSKLSEIAELINSQLHKIDLQIDTLMICVDGAKYLVDASPESGKTIADYPTNKGCLILFTATSVKAR